MQDSLAKINNVCLLILTGIAITIALIYTKGILVPFVFALFFYAIAIPFIHTLNERFKIPRLLSVFLAFLVLALGNTVLILFIMNSIGEFVASADVYKEKVFGFVEWISALAAAQNIPLDKGSIQTFLTTLPIFSYARNITSWVANYLGNVTLIIVFVLFMLMGEGVTQKSHPFTMEIQHKVFRYVITKGLTSLTTGILVGILLAIMSVELAFMFAILTILLNFIPNIGSLFATVLPVPVILLQFGFSWELALILTISGLIQFTIGNIIEPKFMGDLMDLHPITILIFLMFWGLVWGLPGMFLSVPITAILRIILSKIETTKTLSEIMAGRLPEAQHG